MIFNSVFHDRTFNRRILSLAFPIAFQNLMLALVAAGDALMLGQVSQNAMAAVSLATQIQFVQNMFLGSIVGGVGVLGAQYWGKHDLTILRRLFGSSIREAVTISLVFFIGCFFFPRFLMRLFAHDEHLISLGADYLRAASWSYLITGISQCYIAIMRVSNHVSRSAWISSGAVVINILLNAVCIFGLFGVPSMGVKGAALATVFARIIELGWCIGSTFEKNYIRLQLREIFTFHKQLILDFWHYTLPLIGAYLLWGVGFTAYTALMGHMGCDAAAANSIAAVVRDLMCCVCNGFAGGIGILIGNELGAGKLKRGKLYGNRAALLSLLIGVCSGGIILCTIPVFSRCMQLTALAHQYMIQMFMILSVYMIGRCVCTVVINGVLTAGGDTLFDVYSLCVCMWGIALPCAFLSAFCFHLPVWTVYACTCLDEVGKVPWLLHHFLRYKWVRNITR